MAPLTKIQLSEYEEQRLRNLADNQAMLAKLMKDLKKITPATPKTTPAKKTSRKSDDGDETFKRKTSRYNPYPIPARVTRSRSRRGSLSSDGLSSGDSSPVKEDNHVYVRVGAKRFLEEDDAPTPRRASRVLPAGEREIKSVEEITEEDLDNVAECVAVKVYDQVNGTCCHQCRQKTLDQKTICRSSECNGVRGQFCGRCLLNRYGEDAKVTLKDPNWMCPPCRGVCNCSICRTRAGKAATGILIHLAREHGYESVLGFLTSLQSKKAEAVDEEKAEEEQEPVTAEEEK